MSCLLKVLPLTNEYARPPPPTIAGYAGFATRELINETWEEFTDFTKQKTSNSICFK